MEEWQEACWTIIDSYFLEKGLVQQQLGSFNEFTQVTLQHIVRDAQAIDIPAALLHISNQATMAVSQKRENEGRRIKIRWRGFLCVCVCVQDTLVHPSFLLILPSPALLIH